MYRTDRASIVGFAAIALSSWLTGSPVFATDQAQGFEQQWPRTDFGQSIIDLGEIGHGGLPRDAIPAIDNPRFVSMDDASEWLYPREPVIALEMGGEARAYPIQVLIWHEIVNDVPSRRGRYRPQPSQTRTSAIDASGSSHGRFAPRDVLMNDAWSR